MKVQVVTWEKAEPIATTNATASSPVRADCADIEFINLHPTATYLVDGIPVPPLTTFTDGCNQGEWNEHTYTVQGPNPVTVSGYLVGLYVRRKKYLGTKDIN